MKAIEDIFVYPATTIIEALHIIDRGSVQIALVVDEEQRLLGTITDGDVRRGILRGIELTSPVSQVMNREPRTAKLDMDRDMMLSIMQYLNLRQFPVLDNDGRVVRLELIDELLQRGKDTKDNWVVIMAGGLGTRLGELTKDCPKPLLRVGAKPILEIILESFVASGFHRFYLSVNYRADMIRDYFGDGTRWGIEIRYLHETKRLGTAGALGLLPEQPNSPIIVMNGDLLTKVNFRQLVDFHLESGSKATMGVREYEFQVPYGVVQVESNRLRSIEEKPVQKFFTNAGIYVLNPEILHKIPQDMYYDMTTLFEETLGNDLTTSAFPIREYWIDIGRLDDFERANGEFLEVFG
ncbi:nucleotidyltransferase family protein [Paenibacillus sp. CF384]|uniref:nucleotidyltransferase family protein n=1 Tax=Paenibacillus sp. CF384 TaxID=1884382 RepID=UPI0008943144|nr:nucleotidyltransferase family protein [Paenibacillus sp. CF384]SDX28738.1 CBS domain-containing protein [Paenibacillus sp. CF384]